MHPESIAQWKTGKPKLNNMSGKFYLYLTYGSYEAYQFRIYPDEKRKEEIACILFVQQLYNKILKKVKKEYEKGRYLTVNLNTLEEMLPLRSIKCREKQYQVTENILRDYVIGRSHTFRCWESRYVG
ncbi:MAG: hypothetical protein QXR73_01900 [Candidatus Micrarchaeaceae archaeon]